MDDKKPECRTSIEEAEDNVDSKQQLSPLISTIKPVLLLEGFFGIFRVRFSKDAIFPVNGKMKILSVLITLNYIFLFICFRKFTQVITGTTDFIEVVGDEIPSVVVLIGYFLSSLRTSLLFSDQSVQLITILIDLDRRLHITSNKEFYKNSRSVVIKILVVMFIGQFGVSTCDVFSSKAIGISDFVDLPIYMQQSLEVCVFCIMIWTLMHRLRVINNYLANFINKKDSEKSSVFVVTNKIRDPEDFNLIGRPSSDNLKIRELAGTYDLVGEACSLISEIFTFQILMTLINTFIFIVTIIWSSLSYFRTPGNNEVSMATIIMWCIVNICVVAFMSVTCEKLLHTRAGTKILVNKVIMDYDLPKGMRVQAKAFMELIEAWPLRIFVYDMFSVDITLMLKYISVATTYLIVIIQISHYTK